VVRLFARVKREQRRLDVLVNDVWGGDALVQWGVPFWKLDMKKAKTMLRRAVWSHTLTSRHGVPLMLEREAGLIVEITDGDFLGWRGNPHFAESETPWYVGRAVAALAADPNVRAKSGKVFGSWTLAREYGFTDRDGRRPDWGSHMKGEPGLAGT